MAEKSGDKDTIVHKTNYKDIGSIKGELKDADKDRVFVGVAITKNGCILAADHKSSEICIFNKNGKLVKTLPLDHSESIADIVELVDGNIAVSDGKRDCVDVYSKDGEFIGEFVKVFTINGDFVGEFDQIRIR